jgi:hypothetical protein
VRRRTLIHHLWDFKLVQPVWKSVWRFLKNLKIELPYDPTIPLLGIHPKECKSTYKRDTCIPVYIAAKLSMNQPRCPETNDW